MRWRGWLLGLFLPLLAVAGAAASETVHAETAAGCRLALEATPAQAALALRVRDEGENACAADGETVRAFLARALARLPAGARYRSLFLGRLLDHPWLAEALARHAAADAGWDGRRGRPRRGGENAYVAAALERPGLLAPFAAALAGAGYRLAGASVEKVLVAAAGMRGAPGWLPPGGRWPFDAMCHLTLAAD